MANIFISYSRENFDNTMLLIQDIKGLGHSVWYDQDLSGGREWWDHVLEEIRNCDIFVFALSSKSRDSIACKLERDYAVALGKYILPVAVGDYSLNLLPSELLKLHIINYLQRDADTAIKLAMSLSNVPPSDVLPDPLPTPPEMPVPLFSDIYDKLEIKENLSQEEQYAILSDVKKLLTSSSSENDASSLVIKFRRRRDLSNNLTAELDFLIHNSINYKHKRKYLSELNKNLEYKDKTDGRTSLFLSRLKSISLWMVFYLVLLTLIMFDELVSGRYNEFSGAVFIAIFLGSITGSLITNTRKSLYFSLLGAIIGVIFVLLINSDTDFLLGRALLLGVPGGVISTGIILRLAGKS